MLAANAVVPRVDRYVLEVDRATVLDEWGFMDEGMAARWPSGSPDRPQPVVELAGQEGSFVLLAADGAGKSTVLRHLRLAEPASTEVSLPGLEKAEIRHELRQAVAAGGPVYLDALDVAARHLPDLFIVLQDCLTKPPAAGVPWRLACRPAVWDGELAATLSSRLPAFAQMRLLPLTRAAAADVASEVTRRPDEFLDALILAGLGGLAASPMRLQSAARQWHDGSGHLPDSQLGAIRFEIERLLRETNTRQPQVVPLDRRRRLAGRLAAMTIFGQAERFTVEPRSLPGVLYIGDLPSDPEPDDPGTRVTLAELKEVMGTALFDPGPDATVGFRHQQYAEFLAAEYLISRRVISPQLPGLLGIDGDGVIPGPLIGTAAWLAALSPRLGSGFAAANASRLAESAVEMPESGLREALVDGILAQTAAEEMDGLPGQDPAALVHPGLESQLTAHLSGGLTRAGELWWVSRLAIAGQCRGSAQALLREALALQWPPWARRAAVAAAAALGDDEQATQLFELARLGPDDDPDDDVLAAVIEAVFPRLADTAALLGLLRPQRNTSYLGPYLVLLDELDARIPAGDLPAALAWASAHVPQGEDAYGGLIPKLVRRGWDAVASHGVGEPLARLIADLAASPGWGYPDGRAAHPWDGSPSAARRQLAVQVAASLPPGESFPLFDLGLLHAGDLGWLLGALPSLPRPAQDTLARCVSALARQPAAEEFDLIRGMAESHPAYPHTMHLRGEAAIDPQGALRARQRSARAARDAQQRLAEQRDQRSRLAAALRDAEADPGQWWHIARHLARGDPDAGNLFSHDLTARPGWRLLSAAQRQQVLDLGLRYLHVHQLRPPAWAGRPTLRAGQLNDAVEDWSGVCLLTTLTAYEPGRLAALSPSAWRPWIPAIVGAWTVGNEKGRRARCELIDLMPLSERQAVHEAALTHLDALQANRGTLNAWLYEHLCSALAPALAERLTAGRYDGALGQGLLHVLVEHAPQTALPACESIAGTPGHALWPAARRGLAALDPAALVAHLGADPPEPEEMADLAEHLNLAPLDDTQLTALAWLLLRVVPFDSDPPTQYGVFTADRLYQVRRIRRIVMDVLAEHGQERFFRDLAARHEGGGRATAEWYLRQARTQATDLACPSLPPDELLRLLGRADARLVRDDSDLLALVLLQFDDLQRELTLRGASRRLWDFDGACGTPKDENTISEFVRDELMVRLTAQGFIDREVEVTRQLTGIGTRIDLTVTVPAATYPAGTARVTVEAKRATNDSLMTGMHDQLIRQYLIPTGRRHGIYLVYWARPEQWHGSPPDRAHLARELEQQAAEADDGLRIRPYILDISHPGRPPRETAG